jgi:hypothetical protein
MKTEVELRKNKRRSGGSAASISMVAIWRGWMSLRPNIFISIRVRELGCENGFGGLDRSRSR